MERTCQQCGEPFKAQRATAKYCSSTCRSNASTSRVVELSVTPERTSSTSVATLTREALENADRLDTPLGAAALRLAEAMEAAVPGSSAVAAIAKQFQATYAEAMRGVSQTQTTVDELRAKRDQLRRTS